MSARQAAHDALVAEAAATHAAELRARWDRIDWWQAQYLGAAVEHCGIPWPPSLGDARPLPCTSRRGHAARHHADGIEW